MSRLEEMLGYLPEFLREFKEIQQIMTVEDPELDSLLESSIGAVDEQYIQSASDYGLSKFESLLNIHPDSTATLDERRKTVLALWFNSLPFTERQLKNRIAALQGNDDIEIYVNYNEYEMTIVTHLPWEGQVHDLNQILAGMIPVNMVYSVENMIPCETSAEIFAAGGVTTLTSFTVISDIDVLNDYSNAEGEDEENG